MSNLDDPRPRSEPTPGRSSRPRCSAWPRPGREYVRLLDMDGDGLLDYVVADPTEPNGVGDGSTDALAGVPQPGPSGPADQGEERARRHDHDRVHAVDLARAPDRSPRAGGGSPAGDRPRRTPALGGVEDRCLGWSRATDGRGVQVIDYAGFRMDKELREGSGVRLSESEDAGRPHDAQPDAPAPGAARQARAPGEVPGREPASSSIDTTWTVVSEPVAGKSFLVRPTLTESFACDETQHRRLHPSEASSAVPGPRGRARASTRRPGSCARRPTRAPTGTLCHARRQPGARDRLRDQHDRLDRLAGLERANLLRHRHGHGGQRDAALLRHRAHPGTRSRSRAARSGTRPAVDWCASARCCAMRRRSTWATENWTYDGFGNMATYRDAVA